MGSDFFVAVMPMISTKNMAEQDHFFGKKHKLNFWKMDQKIIR